jgi:hypothetical protein
MIHAEAVETTVQEILELPSSTETIEVPNPDYVPGEITVSDDGDVTVAEPEEPQFIEEEVEVFGGAEIVDITEIVHVDQQEVVWDAGDPKWEDRDFEDIAAEQRKIAGAEL